MLECSSLLVECSNIDTIPAYIRPEHPGLEETSTKSVRVDVGLKA